MRVLVAWLNSKGFLTTDSGDGITNVQAGMEGALDFPHVFMVVSPDKLVSEARRLVQQLEREGFIFDGVSRYVEATYNPTDGVAGLMLGGLSDSDFLLVSDTRAQA